MLELLFSFLHTLLHVLQPIWPLLRFTLAWIIIVLATWTVWGAIRDSLVSAKRMHAIPCSNCRFFTNDYHLKCPVRPTIALSELAVNCSDYYPNG